MDWRGRVEKKKKGKFMINNKLIIINSFFFTQINIVKRVKFFMLNYYNSKGWFFVCQIVKRNDRFFEELGWAKP